MIRPLSLLLVFTLVIGVTFSKGQDTSKNPKNDLKPETGTKTKKTKTGTDFPNKKNAIKTEIQSEKDSHPYSQKIFLEKLIEIKKTGKMLIDSKTKLNPIVKNEEFQKNDKKYKELTANFKEALIGGQIKNWQGKINLSDKTLAYGFFEILVGDPSFIPLIKEEIEKMRKDPEWEKNELLQMEANSIIKFKIKVDTGLDNYGLDKGTYETLKKMSNYDSVEFSIKKIPSPLQKDVSIEWGLSFVSTHKIKIDINSKCLETMTPNPSKNSRNDLKNETITKTKKTRSEDDFPIKKDPIATKTPSEKNPPSYSQKIFLEKLIEIKKLGRMLGNSNTKLNPIVRREELEKNETQNNELKQNFKDALIGGQIKNWQGKIKFFNGFFHILIGDLKVITQSKEEIEKMRKDPEWEKNELLQMEANSIMVFKSKIDSGLDEGTLNALKKMSNYELVEFNIKKIPPSLQKDLSIFWTLAATNYGRQSNIIFISSQSFESITSYASEKHDNNLKPETSTSTKTINTKNDLPIEKNSPSYSQKIFLEKLIDIRKKGKMLFDTERKLNPIVREEEIEKIEKQNDDLLHNFKEALIGGQIKNWQGKIKLDKNLLVICIGDVWVISHSKKEIEEMRKHSEEKNGLSRIVQNSIIIFSIQIDSDLDKNLYESIKKMSNYDSVEFSIKKITPVLQNGTINWVKAYPYSPTSKVVIRISPKYLETLKSVSE